VRVWSGRLKSKAGFHSDAFITRSICLLLRNAKVAVLIIVSPRSGHHICVDLSIDHVMNRSAAVAFRIEFHRDGSGVRLERRFGERKRSRSRVHDAAQIFFFPVQLKADGFAAVPA